MTQAFFITGTDTGIGKTYVACKLVQQYVAQGFNVVGMKPIAAGCELIDGEWVNDDVLKLEAASNVKAPRALTNPYSFKDPIAPHIAAQQEGRVIEIAVIKQAFKELCKLADIVIVEGAGGLFVPLNTRQTIADLIQSLEIPVILVIGMKLGCINHALLTMEAIHQRQLVIDKWVANSMDLNMHARQENLEYLQQKFINIKQMEIF